MALKDRLPGHLFSTRGWGLLGAGALSLLAAQIMGRRDLLALAVLLLVLPVLALAGTRVLKPRFQVYREFSPSPVETSARTTVRLAVARTGTGAGHAVMEEHLPARFGESPAFRFPARAAAGGTSRYEYHLRSARRGQFLIGPVTAEFSDPFGLSFHRHAIDDGDLLTVTPAAVELPETGLAGARGHDGVTPTRARANPSDDDVMTREYRHGDPLRRVHWAATARHGSLMVRQEESVTTPEATIILDQRLSAYPHGVSGHGAYSSGGHSGSGEGDGHDLLTCDAFEWAVTAAMSIGAHLAERNYSLRFLDTAGAPAFRNSPSAPDPIAEEYTGTAGLQSIAESLAAIQLSGPHHHAYPHRDRAPQHRPQEATAGANASQVFDDALMDKLSAHRLRGPVLAVLGSLSPAEARALSPAAGFGPNAFALLVTEQAQDSGEMPEVLEALRRGGWRAVAVTPRSSLPDAWAAFDQADPAMSAAADVRRGVGGRP
ncbi:DUF58 domain-containing protein [Arthrobacter sp. ok362]|uniref:DUF58 domain-containing protein n=1 Tax=Arthrobacter sp. ok362 TaxID=1761745 RepID=UPI00088A4AE8|nr:DUF58 domain-containing protein [Arthrobacter sp. ok362]SDK41184.1 Uncharacterized conserved protein, DUF58 family, contains vWF domain [Arthrobacter sp. ok362]